MLQNRRRMPYRRRRRRLTAGKTGIQHADTLVATIGPATVPDEFNILQTEGGPRSSDGQGQTITAQRDTTNIVNAGDIVKYVNLFIEIANRHESPLTDDGRGWLEWALVCVKESETNVPITQLGTLTLGTVCTHMFLNECIYTGMIPVGTTQPNSAQIQIKIPPAKQKIRGGDEWRFITYFRSLKVTATETNTQRLVKSYMYKHYN